MRVYESPMRDAITEAIERDGPMTGAELAQVLNVPRKKIDSSLIHTRHKYGTQFFRISGYVRQVGIGGREAPIYAIGPEPDEPRPKMNSKRDRKKIQQRYRDKNKLVIRARNRKRKGTTSNPFLDILGIKLTEVRK